MRPDDPVREPPAVGPSGPAEGTGPGDPRGTPPPGGPAQAATPAGASSTTAPASAAPSPAPPPSATATAEPRGTQPGADLEAVGLRFAYRRNEPPVLDGLSLVAPAGRLTCILGPNGSGKTTLLRLCAGLLRPAAGEVRLDGRPLAAYRRTDLARRLAYLPQEPLAPGGLTVLETVLLGRSPHTGMLGLETEADWEAVRRALRLTETEDLAERPLEDLSGGQRQRVLVARALAQEAGVLLLDEPTAFLDLRHQHGLYGLLGRLAWEHGKTVLAVGHDLTLAAAYADQVVLVDRGTVAAAGRPAEVLEPAALERVYGVPVEVRTDEATGRPIVLPRPAGRPADTEP